MLREWVQGEAEYRLKILQAVRVLSDMPTFGQVVQFHAGPST